MIDTSDIVKNNGFYHIKNSFTEKEIYFLLKRWKQTPLINEIYHNEWDTSANGKTSLSHKFRKVTIFGIPKNKIKYLSNKIESLFSLFFKEDFGIEGPHYFTQYTEGSFHSLHTDFEVDNGVERQWIMTIQLSSHEDYEGGELIIDGNIAPKDKGSVIIYDGRLEHEVTKVTKGVRYSITECAGKIIH